VLYLANLSTPFTFNDGTVSSATERFLGVPSESIWSSPQQLALDLRAAGVSCATDEAVAASHAWELIAKHFAVRRAPVCCLRVEPAPGAVFAVFGDTGDETFDEPDTGDADSITTTASASTKSPDTPHTQQQDMPGAPADASGFFFFFFFFFLVTQQLSSFRLIPRTPPKQL